ncbi:MAG TPA: bacteriohemerythrin [Rhodocyclaceae bacterium]
MINAFLWSDQFATGIASIDSQHRRLVDLVNDVGNLLVLGETVAEDELQAVFKQLADYAHFHFTDEEQVMAEGKLDPRFVERHHRLHQRFIDQMSAMWRERSRMAKPAETLHSFLTAWLTYHILGEDQAMVREVQRVHQGQPPAAAPDMEDSQSTTVLLHAMQQLYGVVSQQNHDLARANAELEARVASRTAELETAYAKLSADHEQVTALLDKIEHTESRMLQSEKMASIGQLAAGVAHEINNPIGFVNSNMGTLRAYIDDLMRVVDAATECPPAQAVAKEIDLPFLRQDLAALLLESQDGLDRVRKIVLNLKDFSHVDEAEWQSADLIAGLESTVNVVWHELKYKADIVRELQPLPQVRCIPAQINQVFMNLLMNAVQAIEQHGTITLKSGEQDGQVWVEIADSGCGMSAETLRRCFEPFYTTKPPGKGTGLGMSLSYDIIHKHDGRIEIDSAPGKGSRFRLWLPLAGPAENREPDA